MTRSSKPELFQVHNPVASDANQVVVAVHLSVEASCRSGVVHSADQSHFCQRVQDAVDRSSRNPGDTSLHGLVDLVGSGMILSPQHHFQHRAPLFRKGHSPRTANLFELS